jgi:hypothetical protein
MAIRKSGSVVVDVAENWNSLLTFGGSLTYQILTCSVRLFIAFCKLGFVMDQHGCKADNSSAKLSYVEFEESLLIGLGASTKSQRERERERGTIMTSA